MIDLASRTTVATEDALRASAYALLARFLASSPDASLLRRTAGVAADAGTAIGKSLADLAAACAGTDAATAEREYFDLFLGVARGELVPYASYYVTGFLFERPLARVRADLERLGVARAADVSEPEDHIAALCETMSGLASGAFGAVSIEAQRAFFRTHLAGWAPRFFADLESAQAAALYRHVGTFGRLFLALEQEAFAMAA